jgi:hypothetical protein
MSPRLPVIDEAAIDQMAGMIGDAIDSALDDFRHELRVAGKRLSVMAYRAMVEEAVSRAAAETISLFEDGEYLEWLSETLENDQDDPPEGEGP